jgi:hypothetical protein
MLYPFLNKITMIANRKQKQKLLLAIVFAASEQWEYT